MDVDFTEKNIADETAKMDISQDISIWVTPPSPKLGVGTTSCHTEPQLLDNIAVINKVNTSKLVCMHTARTYKANMLCRVFTRKWVVFDRTRRGNIFHEMT